MRSRPSAARARRPKPCAAPARWSASGWSARASSPATNPILTARRFQEAQTRVALAVDGLTYSVAERLAPILMPLLERLANWIAAHSEQIAGFFERVATMFSRWVDGGGLQATVDGLGRFSDGVGRAIDLLGGFQNAAGVLLAFMVGRWALGMVGSVARVTGALGGMAGAMPKGGAVGGGLPGVLGTAVPAVALAASLAEGRTSEDQSSFANDSYLARMGKAIADALGMNRGSGHP